jgi:hypothetical protein
MGSVTILKLYTISYVCDNSDVRDRYKALSEAVRSRSLFEVGISLYKVRSGVIANPNLPENYSRRTYNFKVLREVAKLPFFYFV